MAYIYVNQIQLFSAVLKEIERQNEENDPPVPIFMDGTPEPGSPKPGRIMVPRMSNAIIDACDKIVKELGEEPRWSKPGMGAGAWMQSDDTGQSSLFMAGTLLPQLKYVARARSRSFGSCPCPRDWNDTGRCIRMLSTFTVEELHIAGQNWPELAKASYEWGVLVRRWPELLRAYHEKDNGIMADIFLELRKEGSYKQKA